MEMTIPNPVLKTLFDKGIKTVDSVESWGRDRDLHVDLDKMGAAQVRKMLDIIKQWPHPNDVAKLVRYMTLWLRVYEDPVGAKCQKLEMLPGMVRSFLLKKARGSGFWLYKVEKSDSEVWLPYFVHGASYTSPEKDRPAYVTVSCSYWEQGSIGSATMRFDWSDAHGKTVEQMLASRGYYLESQELRSAYEGDVRRFTELRPKVGMQVLSRGYAAGRYSEFTPMVVDGQPTRLVIDDEGGERRNEQDEPATRTCVFWTKNWKDHRGRYTRDSEAGDDVEGVEGEGDESAVFNLPCHAYLTTFHLTKHYRTKVHVRNLQPYEYDRKLGEKLVLDPDSKDLLEMLLDEAVSKFEDIIAGKSGGTIVLTSGPPGTGKTLTAEVYAEVLGRPIYKVQSSQLGTDPVELEKKLMEALVRAARWGAILLIDEADVYIRERGDDLVQNAIVGVFLRVLEYYNGILFLATNRETIVDDAIESRCTAHIRYKLPTAEAQRRIWRILSDGSGIPIDNKDIADIVAAHPKLAGRDVKNLLKLSSLVIRRRGQERVTREVVEFVLRFRPSASSDEQESKEGK